MITLRIRSMMWFSAGLALALGLMGGTLAWRAEAAPGASESTIVTVTPVRVLDTRDTSPIGLPGPFRSLVPQKLQVTGLISSGAGTTTVVPVGATGVLLNVTVVNPSAAGFLGIRPGNAAGLPSTSSLNFTALQTVPNAVQVALPTSGPNAGQIDIAYNAADQAGPTAEVVIDVVGYTTSAGLQELVADVANRYTKAESDARYPQGYATVQVPRTIASWTTGFVFGVQAVCPPGMVPTGGGGSSGSFDLVLTDSHPLAAGTGWQVLYKNVNPGAPFGATFQAYVHCMRVPNQVGALQERAVDGDAEKTQDGT